MRSTIIFVFLAAMMVFCQAEPITKKDKMDVVITTLLTQEETMDIKLGS